MAQRRVVVTGLGLVTPVGVGVNHAWTNLLKGQCGITKLVGEEYEKLPVQIAAQVPQGPKDQGQFTSSEWLDRGVSVYFMEHTAMSLRLTHVLVGRSRYGNFYTICYCSGTSSIRRRRVETKR